MSAHVAKDRMGALELPGLIASVHGALSKLGQDASANEAAVERAQTAVPAVSIRMSLADPARIISMIDGKPHAMLTRHLTGHGLTPDQHRKGFGLKLDYPLVAPAHAEQRRRLANPQSRPLRLYTHRSCVGGQEGERSMSTTLKASFETRREAEMTIERLVQEYGIERTDIFVVAEGDENSVGEEQAGSDTEAGAPSPEDRDDAALGARISVSVDIEDDDRAGEVRSAFAEFGGDDVMES